MTASPRDLVIWTGPVYEGQVHGATVPGAKEIFINCVGDLTPNCPAIGDQLAAGGLAAVLAKAKMTEPEVGRLFLGAFSAGGSLLKRILMLEEVRNKTTAVVLSDATWTTDAGHSTPVPIEGFVRYALDAATDPGKLFIATASPSPNKIYPTGTASLEAIEREVEKRAGRSFVDANAFDVIDPPPERTRQLGNVLFAYYPLKPLGHGHTLIAPQVWQTILGGWLAGEPSGPAPVEERPRSSGWGLDGWLAFVGASVFAYAATRLLARGAR